jgi:hypothetical protein
MEVFYVVAGIKSGKINVVQTMGSYRIPPLKSVVDPDSLNLEPIRIRIHVTVFLR